MSTYEKKDGDISLFPNNNPTPNSPNYKGTALINGQTYSVSLWKRTSKSGCGEYFAGKVELRQQMASTSAPFQQLDITDNDLPF